MQTPKQPWQEFIERTKGSPPSPFLIKAVTLVDVRNEALDLGAGALNDSKYFLSENFKHVTALDRHNSADEIAEESTEERFSFVMSTFENYEFPKNTFDLINAQFSLPFNPSASFQEVFERMKSSLKPKGIFAGQLFGVNDSWNTPESKLTFHTREQAEKLLADMEVIELVETEKDGYPALGDLKHWHLLYIIARKK